MSIYIDRATLTTALGRCVRLADRRSPDPASGCVRLTTGSDALTMATISSSGWVRQTVPARDAEPGALDVLLSADILARAVKAAPKSAALIEIGGLTARGVRIKGGSAAANVRPIDAEQVPVDDRAPVCTISVHAADLSGAVADVLAAVSDDDARYGLNGVHVEIASRDGVSRLVLVATDGVRLAASGVEAVVDGEIPARMLIPGAWLRVAADLPGERVTLRFSDRTVVAIGDDVEVGTRLIEGEFPEWRQVMPSERARTATITTTSADLHGAARMALVMATERNHLGRIDPDDHGVVIRATHVDHGGAEGLVPAQVEGRIDPIGVNLRLLLDAAPGADDMTITMYGPLEPMVVRDVANEHALWIVMPMRLD